MNLVLLGLLEIIRLRQNNKNLSQLIKGKKDKHVIDRLKRPSHGKLKLANSCQEYPTTIFD